MAIFIQTSLGDVSISNEVIADIVGVAVLECPGVVGMASQKRLKDGVAELLKKENYSRGIIVRFEDTQLHLDLHIVALYGVKILDIAASIQEKVKHIVEHTFGISVSSINIIVEDVKVDE